MGDDTYLPQWRGPALHWLPAIAVVAGFAVLLMVWRGNETLRLDTTAVMASVRRHLVIAILGTDTLLVGATLTAVLLRIITD